MNSMPQESIFDDFDDSPKSSGSSASSSARADASAGANGDSSSAELELLKSEVAEAQERAFRIAAELDNFRKRSRREMEEGLKFAQLPLARDLLSIVDNLQRALEAASEAEQAGGLIQGVRMVANQLLQVLRSHQCEAIPALGQPFDPNLHQALQMEASTEYPANTVSRELSSGYRIHDRVIRPAQVFVSTGPGPEAE